MTKLLALALLLLAAGPRRSGDATDPAGAGTTAAADAAAKRGDREATRRRDPEPRADGEGKGAAPKDEKPCQPVKPCPID